MAGLNAERAGSGQRISRAALTLFAENGYAATGIRDIGAHAGVSTSVLYHYVSSKEDALYELIEDGLGRHARSVEDAANLSDRPEEQLAALIAVHIIVPLAHPAMSQLLQQEATARVWVQRSAIQDLQSRVQSTWTNVLTSGRDERVFDFESVPVMRSALLRCTTRVSDWYRTDGELDEKALVESFVDFAFGATRARRNGRYLRARALTRPSLSDLRLVVARAHEGIWW